MQVMEKKQMVGLVGMEFYAYHGLYEAERKTGNDFIVDVYVYYQSDKFSEDRIENTLNYELIYNIVKEKMSIPAKLIEHLGEQMIADLKKITGADKTVKVVIKKKRPPLHGVVNYAIFEIEW
jgi:dihydroneopterin aldolase